MATGSVWVIVVSGTPRGNWGRWHLFWPHTWPGCRKTGYQHCVAIREVPGGYLLVDPHNKGLAIRYITETEMVKMRAIYNRLNATAWQIRATQQHLPLVGIYTCSTVISRLCGLRGLFWAPYRLSCALPHAGAVPFCPIRWRILDES